MDLKLLNIKLFENREEKRELFCIILGHKTVIVYLDGPIRGHLGVWGWVYSLLLVCCCYPPQAGSWS